MGPLKMTYHLQTNCNTYDHIRDLMTVISDGAIKKFVQYCTYSYPFRTHALYLDMGLHASVFAGLL